MRLIPSIPALRLPALRSTCCRASCSHSWRHSKWYKSRKRCVGWAHALRAKLSCVLRRSFIHLQNAQASDGLASVPPTISFVSLSATLRPVRGFPSRRLLWSLRRSTIPSTTASPVPLQDGWSSLPRSRFDPLRRKVGSSCTPVRCLLTSPSSSAGFDLGSHCRFARCARLFTFPMRRMGYPMISTPSPSVDRVLTLWARLTEISDVTLFRLGLAVLGS